MQKSPNSLILLRLDNNQQTLFKVSRAKTIQLVPDIDTLLADEVYHFQLRGMNIKNIDHLEFDGGRVIQSDTDIVMHTIAKTSAKHKYILDVFAVKNNKVVSVFQKVFTVISKASVPDPELSPTRVRFADIYFGPEYISQSFTLKLNIGALMPKMDILLKALVPVSQSHSSIESSLIIQITGQDNKPQYYSLHNGFVLNAEQRKQLIEMKPGSKVEISAEYHSFRDPPEDAKAGPYIFVIKE
jgi:hypothetical protein